VIWTFASADASRAERARHQFVNAMRLIGGDQDYSTAELIFGELIGNVVRHAPGEIFVRLDWTAAHPVLTVLDTGTGFEYAPHLPGDLLAEGGRGLYIVSALARNVDITRNSRGTNASVELPYTRRPDRPVF